MFWMWASVNMALKVGAGMEAWPLSGPLYIPIITFGCITPTTRKVDWLIWTVLPTGSSLPKRFSASSSPSTTTRRLSVPSISSTNRPPSRGMMLRISPKDGSTPRTRALTVLAPWATGTRLAYSRLTLASSGMRAASSSASSSVNEMLRPEGRPMQARVVAPGQSTPMPSPMPREFRWNERFMPSPNESSSTIDSVPQAMAMTVRPMRLRLRAASTRNSRQTSSSSVALISGQLQRDHGVEQRGPPRREVAREQPDHAQQGGGGEDHDGGGLRRAHVLVERGGEHRDHAQRDQEAEHAPHGGEGERLHQELAEDEARLGPHRELDPDLARPLLHHHVHDVGDADPAHDEGEGADHAQEGAEHAEEHAEELLALRGVPHADGFLVLGVELEPAAEHLVDLARHLRHQRRVPGLEDDVVDVAVGEEAAVGRLRHEGLVLVAPAVARVLGLLPPHPDH